jgi:hypothetical protein
MLGGLLGFAPLAAIAAGMLVDPQEIGRPFAAVPALMAVLYLPAVWVSVARTERRQPILRGSVVLSLVLAFGGSFMFGFPVLMVLAPATVLLWLASGGTRRDGRR